MSIDKLAEMVETVSIYNDSLDYLKLYRLDEDFFQDFYSDDPFAAVKAWALAGTIVWPMSTSDLMATVIWRRFQSGSATRFCSAIKTKSWKNTINCRKRQSSVWTVKWL